MNVTALVLLGAGRARRALPVPITAALPPPHSLHPVCARCNLWLLSARQDTSLELFDLVIRRLPGTIAPSPLHLSA